MKGFGARASCAAMVVVFAVLAAPAASYASVVYDLTLTATFDTDGSLLSTYNGTGTITLSSAPDPNSQTNYSSAAVTFLVDGQSFSGNASSVQFLDGNFRNASFSEQIGTTPVRFDLQTTSGYAFYYNNELQEAAGTITSALAPTPLPAALPLFAGGIGIIGLLSRRKKRKGQGAPAQA
ncbi:MAG: hypothetical protein WAU89_01685 [Candidatus Acidiferrales bacterium]